MTDELRGEGLLAARRDALEEAAKACEDRARAYREAKAPGWFEVDHECTQCAAAIRALATPN